MGKGNVWLVTPYFVNWFISFIDGHLNSPYIWGLLWTMNIHVQVLCGHMFSILLGLDLGAELLGHMMTAFYLWRDWEAVF